MNTFGGVICLRHIRPLSLKVLNDTKLILNDQAHEFHEVIFFHFQGKVHRRPTAIYVGIFQNQSETKPRGKIGNEQAFGSQHAYNHDFLL